MLRDFINKANAEYFYWDELRYRVPGGLTADEAWAAVKLSRSAKKPLPLLDPAGRPFTYWLPDQAQETIHIVDRQGGGVLATDIGMPDLFSEMRERVLIDSLMEEAIATSQIEGAVTTRKVAKEMLRSGRKPKDRSEQMIVNGFETIRFLRDRLDRPLSIDLLHETQASITRDTLENARDTGRFRTDSDDVRIVDTRDNEVVFTPPPARDLPERISRLVEFANADARSQPFLHPLVRAAVLHFWLAYEHPYVDGNGRTARALFYWAMLRSGYWLFEFVTISRVIHASTTQYYRSFLHSEQDENDLTYSLVYQLNATRRSLAELHKRLKEMTEQQQRMKAIRSAAKLNARQRAVLDHALRHPSQTYTFDSHRRSHGISFQTARTDLLGLVDRGLLVDTGSLRPREFVPAPDLQKKLRIADPRRRPNQ